MTREEQFGCRVLMRDGVPLVPAEKLPKPRFPEEVSKERQLVDRMFANNGSIGADGDLGKVYSRVKNEKQRHGIIRGDRGLMTRYRRKEDL